MVVASRWRGIFAWRPEGGWLGRIPFLLSMKSPLNADASQPRPDVHSSMAIFEAFVHQHERQILNYLWRMTGDEQTAFDLSQETFLRAWQHFTKISEYERPRAWLFHVASNLAISHLRQQPGAIADASMLDEDASATNSDPMMHFVESDLVRQILHALPPRRRAALILCEVYGFTAEEVGQVLGMTTNAVKMALSRGREQFRQIYAKEMQP